MTEQRHLEVVLSDLDGVIRHFPDDHRSETEQRHGLEPGILAATAFEDSLLAEAVTGRRTRASWIAEIGRQVGSPTAASEWLAERGSVDPAILELYDELREQGIRVAVLTNGTDTVEAELREFDVFDRFDAVFSTWDIGFAKPDRRAFEHVVRALDVRPEAVLFTDDSPSKLAGATELGMATHHFVDVSQLRADLDRICTFRAPSVDKPSVD